MATMVKLYKNVTPIVEEVYVRKNAAEANRVQEYHAAVKIQSWYRALRARAYLRYIVDCSSIIQKRYRGFQGRKQFRQFLKDEVFSMKLNRYNHLATQIQKVWRGYYVRKYIFNYYSFKRYLNGLLIKNESIREKLASHKEQQLKEKMQAEASAKKAAEEKWFRDHHYLVSTVVVPGVYNSPYQPPQWQERSLKLVRWPEKPETKSESGAHMATADMKPKYNPTATRYDLPSPKPPSLPPLHQRPQGPFRRPDEVREQRYRSFNPTLRVETSYTAVEEAREEMKRKEWVNRLIDTPFKPFTRRHRDYEPLHHTTTAYGHIPYGNAYFREENQEKLCVKPALKTVVPPIPVFDKLNTTYSQGEV